MPTRAFEPIFIFCKMLTPAPIIQLSPIRQLPVIFDPGSREVYFPISTPCPSRMLKSTQTQYPILTSQLILTPGKMIAPFSIEEKQRLIETVKVEDKIKTFDKIVTLNLFELQENKTVQ